MESVCGGAEVVDGGCVEERCGGGSHVVYVSDHLV